MSRRHQFALNARCLSRAFIDREWHKLPHFHRGLCRAALRHDRLGNAVAYLWPLAALGVVCTLLVVRAR